MTVKLSYEGLADRAGWADAGVALPDYDPAQLAEATKKARMKPCDMSNPRYQMRSWLLRLGFIGEQYERPRRTLMEALDGDSAFFTDEQKQKAMEKRRRSA